MSGGRIVIIGGGSPGIAAAIALACREKGMEVVVYENGKHLADLPDPPRLSNFPMLERATPKLPPANDIKQLRSEQRAREKQTRKMLPKGRK